MSFPFASVFVALPTPFDDQGRIDIKALEHLVDYLLPRSFEGIAILTEAAEDSVLTQTERRRIVELVGDRVKSRKALLVGISTPSTQAAVELARLSEQKGAKGLLVAPLRVPGIGYREIYRHVEKIGRAQSLPIFPVVRPGNAPDGLAPEELSTLAKHPRLQGVFLPGGAQSQIKEWARRLKDRDGDVFGGCALTFPQDARSGATSAICGVTLIAAELTAQLIAAVRKRDVKRIQQLEKQLAPAIHLLGPPKAAEDLEGVKKLATKLAKRPLAGSRLLPTVPFVLIKEALVLLGHPVKNLVRPPFAGVAGDERDRLRAVMKSAGLLS